jgi:hypothetical protein
MASSYCAQLGNSTVHTQCLKALLGRGSEAGYERISLLQQNREVPLPDLNTVVGDVGNQRINTLQIRKVDLI